MARPNVWRFSIFSAIDPAFAGSGVVRQGQTGSHRVEVAFDPVTNERSSLIAVCLAGVIQAGRPSRRVADRRVGGCGRRDVASS